MLKNNQASNNDTLGATSQAFAVSQLEKWFFVVSRLIRLSSDSSLV